MGTVQKAAAADSAPTAAADSAAAPAAPTEAAAPGSGGAKPDELAEIVVTAQKRAQTANSVGMSINAIGGESLTQLGVESAADLAKVVPGFVYTPSTTLSPVYTIRGVGFFDASLASAPAVSVYVDEIPVPFPIMSQGAALDLERVEVLKGPQGILFGENSTGGAVNYIAAKPTDTFKAGFDVSDERFGRVDFDGFVSGPVSSTLDARLAVKVVEGGAWQYSTTRPGDRLGDANLSEARLLLDWRPTDKLKVAVDLDGFVDQSQTQAGQLIAITPVNPAVALPQLLQEPLAPANDRAADWTTNQPNRNNNYMGHAAVRADYVASDSMTLTSITSYDYMNVDTSIDGGAGTGDLNLTDTGSIKTIYQELRATGNSDNLDWIGGANYEHDIVNDIQRFDLQNATTTQPLAAVPGFENVPPYLNTFGSADQIVDTYAVFGNLDYHFSRQLSAQAGVRYTDSLRSAAQCAGTTDANNGLGQLFTALQEFAGKTNPILVPPGDCVSIDPATGFPTVQPYKSKLDEDNVSWRIGLTYKVDDGPLVYANVSRGFKAGSIPTVADSSTKGDAPARQEEVTAYETGFKWSVNHRLEVNGAAFYYDYLNKQLRTSIDDPTFGLLEVIGNVPKSRVWGAESDIVALPLAGLRLNLGLTYVNSQVTAPYVAYNGQLQQADFNGSVLPLTPRYQGIAGAEYDWSLGNGLRPFVGGQVRYQSNSNATFSVPAASADEFNIDAYALLDLRAGFAAADDRWRVTFYGDNVTNKYYWTGVLPATDVVLRYAGRPAVYGVRLSVRVE